MDLVYDLARIHCTDKEIADIVKVSRKTLTNRCSDVLSAGRSQGKASLRRKQWMKADEGNAQMLIWLGKNWLGQSDNPTQEDSVVVLPWEDEGKKDAVDDTSENDI